MRFLGAKPAAKPELLPRVATKKAITRTIVIKANPPPKAIPIRPQPTRRVIPPAPPRLVVPRPVQRTVVIPARPLRQIAPRVGAEVLIASAPTPRGVTIAQQYGQPTSTYSPGPAPMPGGTMFNEPARISANEVASSELTDTKDCAPYTGSSPAAGFFDEEKNVLFKWAAILGAGYLFFKYTGVGRRWASAITGKGTNGGGGSGFGGR